MTIADRISEAKEFLQENPKETVITVARIFNLSRSTLQRSITREKTAVSKAKKDSQNKILEDYQITAIHGFIRRLLTYGIPLTKPLILNAIGNLKLKENPFFPGPSQRGFQTGGKANNLHTIRTKPLATICYTAADAEAIEEGFKRYRLVLKKLNIWKKRNIINFDEQGIRIGYMKSQNIVMPEDVLEFYALSPENRQSLTIFENINAVDDLPLSPMLVIQGQELIKSGFSEHLSVGTRILTSPTDFTSDEIGLAYLKHYIENSNADSNVDGKLMLMNNHGNHITPEFALLAAENHIRPYSFIPHLTHCMQSLDVVVF